MENKYYYGTSSLNAQFNRQINTEIEALKELYSKKRRRISVTNDLNAAKYYADKSVEKYGGDPIIYQVDPDRLTMVKTNKTDFITQQIKIIGEINYEEEKSKLSDSNPNI